MNQYTQVLLLRQFHNDTLNKSDISDDYLNKWVKKYFKSNNIKQKKINCKPLQSPYHYNNGDTLIGQDNNIYTCVQHIYRNKIEMAYWKKPKFKFDRKLPHLSPKNYPLGYTHLGHDNETMYIIKEYHINNSYIKRWIKHYTEQYFTILRD